MHQYLGLIASSEAMHEAPLLIFIFMMHHDTHAFHV
jgi:hypothetical protein